MLRHCRVDDNASNNKNQGGGNKSHSNQDMVGGAVLEEDRPVVGLRNAIVDEAVEDLKDQAV